MQPCDDKFATEILDYIKGDLRGCRDVAKLLAASNVLSHFALWPEPARSHALGQLLFLLGYRYPRVRCLFTYMHIPSIDVTVWVTCVRGRCVPGPKGLCGAGLFVVDPTG